MEIKRKIEVIEIDEETAILLDLFRKLDIDIHELFKDSVIKKFLTLGINEDNFTFENKVDAKTAQKLKELFNFHNDSCEYALIDLLKEIIK